MSELDVAFQTIGHQFICELFFFFHYNIYETSQKRAYTLA